MPQSGTALVTGGNKGIGRTIAEHLARAGFTVVVNFDKDQDSARDTLAQVQALAPGSISVQSNVASPDGARDVITRTFSEFGRLDVLVTNVGPFLVKSLADTEVDEWHGILDGNLSSAFYCSKFAIPIMREQRQGHIVNLGSLNAEMARGAPTTAAYNIAKTGLVVMTKSVARSEARYGIRCNIVNPGFIDTYGLSEENRRDLPALIPLGFLGEPEDVANAVDFLVSDQARYITGAVLNVHGGLWV